MSRTQPLDDALSRLEPDLPLQAEVTPDDLELIGLLEWLDVEADLKQAQRRHGATLIRWFLGREGREGTGKGRERKEGEGRHAAGGAGSAVWCNRGPRRCYLSTANGKVGAAAKTVQSTFSQADVSGWMARAAGGTVARPLHAVPGRR